MDWEPIMRISTTFRLGLAALALLSAGCSVRGRAIPEVGVGQIPLATAQYDLLDWVEAKACATYVFGLRFPENKEGARRVGKVTAGSTLGGGPPNADAADALYEAMVKLPSATHILVPNYLTQGSGLALGNHILFGRQCAVVRARGLALKG
jgi:hypothetical protein